MDGCRPIATALDGVYSPRVINMGESMSREAVTAGDGVGGQIGWVLYLRGWVRRSLSARWLMSFGVRTRIKLLGVASRID